MASTPEHVAAHTRVASNPHDSTSAGYLNERQLAARFAVHRTTIWRWVRESDFPPPVRFSEKCTRWPLAAVLSWEAKHTAERACA